MTILLSSIKVLLSLEKNIRITQSDYKHIITMPTKPCFYIGVTSWTLNTEDILISKG